MSKEITPTRTEKILFVVNQMLSRGKGASCSTDEISQWSGFLAQTQNLSYFVSDVRAQLAEHGLYLSGEGQDGAGFFVVRASENAVVAARFKNKANKALQQMQVLLEKTDRSELTQAEQRRHEKELRELRYTNRLIERKEEVVEVIRKHRPGLLKPDVEV